MNSKSWFDILKGIIIVYAIVDIPLLLNFLITKIKLMENLSIILIVIAYTAIVVILILTFQHFNNSKRLKALEGTINLNNILKTNTMYQSETSKFKHLFLDYCKGNGIDIGTGGSPINNEAISIDFHFPYAQCGHSPINIKTMPGNTFLPWFANDSLDYVYSSHLLEDFQFTEEVLTEWIRVIKPLGYLCLLLPNEKRYREYCSKKGFARNVHHIHGNFSLNYVKDILLFKEMKIIKEADKLIYTPEESDYNFAIIAQKPE